MSLDQPAGNYELQKEFLDHTQREISGRLFEKGVIARIAQVAKYRAGAPANLEGFGQLDKIFVPGLGRVNDKGHVEEELSLVAITYSESPQHTYTYLKLGRIDAAGILFPYTGIPAEDAEIVQQAARELVRAKEEGVLPNLNASLLWIDNPHTGIAKLPD